MERARRATRRRMSAAVTAAAMTALTACSAHNVSSSTLPDASAVADTPEAGAAPSAPADTVSGPPKTPTDIVDTAGWIEGVVTRGGTGPCFGLTDVDGVEYGLYIADGTTLAKGATIRAQVTPLLMRINCGSGEQVQAATVQRLN